MSEAPFPVLYILMRTDLDSMNCGKAVAQGSHASNAFVFSMLKKMADAPIRTAIIRFMAFLDVSPGFFRKGIFTDFSLFLKWVKGTPQGFGTVLVLGVTEAQLRQAIETSSDCGFAAEVIHDPTYPLVDGDTVHFLPLDTCGYVFGDKNNPLLSGGETREGGILSNFNLHP